MNEANTIDCASIQSWLYAKKLNLFMFADIPACGAGAFLLPILRKIRSAWSKRKPIDMLRHIEDSVLGLEIDPYSAWLSQVFLEVELKDLILEAKHPIAPLVKVVNSIEFNKGQKTYDLVIGNPPYGKLKLDDSLRSRFAESLYGHPNLYGLFTHLAVDFVAESGVIVFLTPTSFLSGEYFKNLRRYLRMKVMPSKLEFIKVRKGIFEDVLQETMISTFNAGKRSAQTVSVNEIYSDSTESFATENSGDYTLPESLEAPWILPRNRQQAAVVSGMLKMHHNLNSWGYQINTGPLVWNRHKAQLTHKKQGAYPIIWAESVSADGTFMLKSERKNHVPFIQTAKGDEWLVTKKSCILLQRTTAKEQKKRLICAVLPESLVGAYNGVVVENHLNMISPINPCPPVNIETLSVFLNSAVVNECFRTISGSVAVSAYELLSLPLPDPKKLESLAFLVATGATTLYEQECLNIYLTYQ